MRVKVENCHGGHGNYYFRCTLPNGDRFNVGHNTDGDSWDRSHAKEMRDYITTHYPNVARNSIKVV